MTEPTTTIVRVALPAAPHEMRAVAAPGFAPCGTFHSHEALPPRATEAPRPFWYARFL
jgi:hypothetical protein